MNSAFGSVLTYCDVALRLIQFMYSVLFFQIGKVTMSKLQINENSQRGKKNKEIFPKIRTSLKLKKMQQVIVCVY